MYICSHLIGTRIADLVTTSKSLLEEFHDIAASILEDSSRITGEVTRLREDNGDLSDDNGYLTGEVARLREDNGRLAGEVARLREDNGRLVGEVAHLSEDSSRLAGEVAHLSEDNDRLAGEVAQLRGQASRFAEDMMQMRVAMETQNSRFFGASQSHRQLVGQLIQVVVLMSRTEFMGNVDE